jgi:hypothetical protein
VAGIARKSQAMHSMVGKAAAWAYQTEHKSNSTASEGQEHLAKQAIHMFVEHFPVLSWASRYRVAFRNLINSVFFGGKRDTFRKGLCEALQCQNFVREHFKIGQNHDGGQVRQILFTFGARDGEEGRKGRRNFFYSA